MSTKAKSAKPKTEKKSSGTKKSPVASSKPGKSDGAKPNEKSTKNSESEKAHEITQADLARILGYSRARISQIITEEGCPVVKSGKQGRAVRIDAPGFMAWWVQRALNKELAKVPHANESSDKVGTLEEEEKRLVAARARKVETETYKLKGELVPVAEVADLLNELAVLYSSGLEAIPGRMANELSNIDSPAEIRQRIFGEIRRIRKSTADTIRQFGASHRGSDHIGGHSGRSTTEDA